MGVRITGKLIDGVTASHTHGPSNDTLATTAPKDNGGTGEHFSPTDLLTTGYAACTTTIMALWARPRGYNLDGVQYSVEKIMSAETPRRIVGLPMTVKVPDDIPAEERDSLETAAKSCPVALSIHPEIDTSITFEYVSRESL